MSDKPSAGAVEAAKRTALERVGYTVDLLIRASWMFRSRGERY